MSQNGVALGVAFSSPTLDVVTANEIIVANLSAANLEFDAESVPLLTADEIEVTDATITSAEIDTLEVTSGITGDLTGGVTGNLTGDVTGNLTGNVTGNVTSTGYSSLLALNASKFNTNSATSGTTLLAANVTGGCASVDLQLTGTLSGDEEAQLPLVSAMTNKATGTSYRLRITNASADNHGWTITTNTGWTLSGTMTIAQNTWREFVVTFASASAATLQSVAVGTYS